MKKIILKTIAAIGFAAITSFSFAQASEMRQIKDDLGRDIQIPVLPTAIVALHDSMLTLPLIELGVLPVGSDGRTDKATGRNFIRAGKSLTGIDFDNSSIKYVSSDLEKIAAVKPDLIIISADDQDILDKLQAIAPTFVIDYDKRTRIQIFEILAELSNTVARLDTLKARYNQQIQDIKNVIDTQNITVNVIQPSKGKILVWNSYFSLGKVLRDAGFKFPKIVNEIKHGERAQFSAEKLQELDADYIFVTYRTDRNHTPQNTVADFENVIPDFCSYLKACRENQMLVMPREAASSNSFTALGLSAFTVLTHISGNPYKKLAK